MADDIKTGAHVEFNSSDEKAEESITPIGQDEPLDDAVFSIGADVNFRTNGWFKTSTIFLKIVFATGVLNIPGAYVTLGAVGGSIICAAWVVMNTYLATILGDFQVRHRQCHNISDMAGVVGGPVLREIVGFLFVVAFIISTGAGILSVSIALNALSNHSMCTVWFSFFAMLIVGAAASFRKLEQIGILTFIGFISIFVSVFILVVAVTLAHRPYAAPETGPYDLGFYTVNNGGFSASMSANALLFISCAGEIGFVPVISEMRDPREFRKALYLCMGFVGTVYIAFSLVVYWYCGQWITTPSLGSAGGLYKKITYGIAFIGLIISGSIYLHLCAKYIFVRILRKSRHLQSNTFIHWFTWLASVWIIAAIGFVWAEGIPVFSWMGSISGAICFSPLSIILPSYLWVFDHGEYRTGTVGQKVFYWAHWLLFVIGVFMCVGGIYAISEQIHATYASDPNYGTSFSCADNSKTIA